MAGINNTPFTPDHDKVAQLTGTGRPTPGFNGSTTIGAGFTPVYAASIDIAPFLVKSSFVNITTTALGNATITCSNIPPAGAVCNIQIFNDAGGARTITFGTGFRASGTIVGTASRLATIEFISDGTTFNEFGRTLVIV